MEVSALEMTAIGAASAFCEVSLLQPTVAVKNALQEGRAVPTSLRGLYRGYLMNAGSIMPITAVAMGSQAAYSGLVESLTGEKPGMVASIGVAAAAGFTSCVVASPTETVVVQQQRQKAAIFPTIRGIANAYGHQGFFRGTILTGKREALYAMGYMGLYPPLKAYLDTLPSLKGNDAATTVLAACVAGSAGALSSHPFDTVKTRMQVYLNALKGEKPEYSNSVRAWKSTYAEGGWSTLMSGAVPRTLRIICACVILNTTRGVFVDALMGLKGQKPALEGGPELQAEL